MNGGMRESKDRTVHWPDVDPDTFIRLCEFAHVGDYTPPLCVNKHGPDRKKRPLSTEDAAMSEETKVARNFMADYKRAMSKLSGDYKISDQRLPPFSENLLDDLFPKTPSGPPPASKETEIPSSKQSSWNRYLRATFLKNPPILPKSIIFSDATHAAPEGFGPWDDFAPVLFGQGRLYALADKYGIESLCQIIIYKLYKTLKTLGPHTGNIIGVLEFVRFVYVNTPPGYGEKRDGLRNLVTRYIVSIVVQIGKDKAFRDLLAEGGDFVTDFWDLFWELHISPSSSQAVSGTPS